IPLYSCPECREEARAAYAEALEKGDTGFDLIYLQDRAGDDFRYFDGAADTEKAIK
ncbi:MAG: histone deacetylase, partial [Firmicutes bacterium]|nr:histone deacetylase [Bacillota bacterium]